MTQIKRIKIYKIRIDPCHLRAANFCFLSLSII